MYDVICIGSATFDMFVKSAIKFSDAKPGDKVLLEHIEHSVGGGGINSSVALLKMGLKTAFLGKLGNDEYSMMIEKELAAQKVGIINKKKDDKLYSSYSVILSSALENDRIVYAYKGASDNLLIKDFKLSDLKSKWIYMATMMGESFKTCEKIAKYAKKNDIKILFNPSLYLAKKGARYLKNILANTTILVLNFEEAQALTGSKTDNDVELARKLTKLGPKIVAITEGKKGVYAYDGHCRHSLDAFDVKVVSTLGAGDAFTSGFLAGIIKTGDLSISLEMGMANAASVIQKYGARANLLTYKGALDFLHKRKEKVLKITCELKQKDVVF